MYRRTLGTLLTLALLAALPAAIPARSQSVAAVAAPVLKWAYGGCSPSSCETGWYASPAVADLEPDGQPDVIWGAYDVVAVSGATGALKWRGDNNGRVWPGIAVADLTGDGTLEVIVGRERDQLTVYSNTGAVVWTRNPFGASAEIRTLAVEDLEADGQLEIIVGRANNGRNGERSIKQVSVYEPDGSVRPGWPARREGEPGVGANMYNQNVAVADLNNDGLKEVIAPTDVHYITALDQGGNQLPANPIYGAGKVWSQVGVHVLHEIDLRGFADCDEDPSIPIERKLRPNFANSAPVIADMDGDGTREIVVVGDVYNCAPGFGDPNGDMYHMPLIFKIDRTRWSGSGFDWTAIPPDPGTRPLSQDYNVIQNSVTNAVPADLDGDGVKEILFPSYDGRLHAYWLDKTQHGAWPFVVPGSGFRFASEPAVVDLDADGQAEVIFTSWPENGGGRIGQLHILDSLGNQLYAVDLPAPRGDDWNGGLGGPTVANIDADADMEVVVGTVSSGVVAYDLPGSAGARVLWGTGRGSNKRTGLAPLDEGFSLRVTPAAQVVDAAGVASYSVDLQSSGAFGAAVDLVVTISPPGPAVTLTPGSVTPPGSATLTVTDTHPAGPLVPGAFYTVQITATGGPFTRTATVSLLVGGTKTSLPVVVR